MRNNSLKIKILSALEKCFYDDSINSFKEQKNLSLLINETASFQVAYFQTDKTAPNIYADVRVSGELQDCISIKQVTCVPVSCAAKPVEHDENYLRTTPGLYPDLIEPLRYANRAIVVPNNLRTLWCDIKLNDSIKAGDYATTISFYDGNECLAQASFSITVIEASLPENDIPHTEWFYCDCLAQYYDVEMFSDEHWCIIENFLKTAVENDINMVMMPIITPALDTYVGGERPTCQLVDISLNNGVYSFDFSKVDRWINMCKKIGIKYYEMPPFYTQWGAKSTPKIVAAVNGEQKRIFGWDTDSLSDEYVSFLNNFIPALIERLKLNGIDNDTYFHVSDEPEEEHLDHYNLVADNIKRHIKGYKMIDAVSDVNIYKRGILDTPVVILRVIHKFLDAGANNCWAYYCNSPSTTYSNRFMSMPSARTRIIGVQLYKFNIKGFLHWGYNYYNNQFSYDAINPYLDTTGDYFAPAGDTFLVYPAKDKTAAASLRLNAMRDAFQDYRALKLCEKLYSREFVLSLISEGLDFELTFDNYPKDADYLLNLRQKVNAAINKAQIKQ